jgi:hypothetical protein
MWVSALRSDTEHRDGVLPALLFKPPGRSPETGCSMLSAAPETLNQAFQRLVGDGLQENLVS